MPLMPKGVYRKFFSGLGFDDNPFAHTNADEEERLPDYFISPPYFPTVLGNPDEPKSFVIFAPRGGGKSAQRIMIENYCSENGILAITYARFDFPEVDKARGVKLQHHLRRILRFSVMGLLVTISDQPELAETLSSHDRDVIVKLAGQYLSGTTEANLKTTLDSLKSLKDKVKDFWNEWLPVIEPGMRVLLSKLLGSDVGDLAQYETTAPKQIGDLKYQLGLIVDLSEKLGYRSVYILIDRVDEAELTGNDARASFSLIEPLLKDLELLEFPGMGVKLFLWDQLEPLYSDIARTDRIRKETLEWSDDMLDEMWEKRLLSYSHGAVAGLRAISEETEPENPDRLALIFANRSPRDMIRIGDHIIAEQQEISLQCERIEKEAVYRGIEKFCSVRAEEVVSDKTLQQLRKAHQADFTIAHLANYVFKEKHNTTRSRIYRWRGEGAIVDVGRVPSPRSNRPVKLIALRDIRVAKEVFSDLRVDDFLDRKYRQCPRCGASVLRDWGDANSLSTCHECQFDLESGEPDSMEAWQRERLAERSRRRQRFEQLSLWPADGNQELGHDD